MEMPLPSPTEISVPTDAPDPTSLTEMVLPSPTEASSGVTDAEDTYLIPTPIERPS